MAWLEYILKGDERGKELGIATKAEDISRLVVPSLLNVAL